jgi:hypothetical protein
MAAALPRPGLVAQWLDSTAALPAQLVSAGRAAAGRRPGPVRGRGPSRVWLGPFPSLAGPGARPRVPG